MPVSSSHYGSFSSVEETYRTHSFQPVEGQVFTPAGTHSQALTDPERGPLWLDSGIDGPQCLPDLFGNMPIQALSLPIPPHCAMRYPGSEQILFSTMDFFTVFGDMPAQAPPGRMYSSMSVTEDVHQMMTPSDAQYTRWSNSQSASSTWNIMQAETHNFAAPAPEVPSHAAGHSKPPSADRKVRTIIGRPSLPFHSNAGNYVRIGAMLWHDLSSLIDREYRGYLSGFKSKVTYVIAMQNKPAYRSKQRYCLQNIQGRQVYYTRTRLAQEVSSVVEEFLRVTPNFHTDPAFQAWPAGSSVENFILLELRKISRASIQIVLGYLPTTNT